MDAYFQNKWKTLSKLTFKETSDITTLVKPFSQQASEFFCSYCIHLFGISERLLIYTPHGSCCICRQGKGKSAITL